MGAAGHVDGNVTASPIGSINVADPDSWRGP